MNRAPIVGCLLGLLQSCAGSPSDDPTYTSQGGAINAMASGGASAAGASIAGGRASIPGGLGGSAARAGTGSPPGGATSSSGGTSPTQGGRAPSGSGATNVAGETSTDGGGGLGGVATSSGGALAGGGALSSGGQPSGGSNQSAGSAGASAGRDWTELLAPRNGALLGGFIGSGTVASTEAQLGRKWAMRLQYFDWRSDFTAFARDELNAGRIPYVTWEPWTVTLDAIASGAEDATLRSRAASIAGLSGKVLLRFAHEMNGDWYPWDGADNGANSAAPPKYIAAYRHVHDVFTSAGADNVLWVFCPNVDSVPNEPWNEWENYYPGDAVVDWLCFDGYNWANDTFASMTARIYPSLAAKNKPILLGETSSHEVEKAAWIAAIVPAMQSEFPLLKALVWFHTNKEHDWRYDSNQSSLAAFVAMAKDPYFNP